jgi:hypothetical protein
MINKNITKIFNRKYKQQGAGMATRILDPKYVWRIIISLFVVLNFGVMVFSGYLFLEINSRDIFKIENNTTFTIDTIDRTFLRETLESFEKMKVELEKLKNKRPNVIDPSL